MDDYGFELLFAQPFDWTAVLESELLSLGNSMPQRIRIALNG